MYPLGVHAFDLGPAPITKDKDGVLRVAGTRVTLDSIVAAFDLGSTPEEIRREIEAQRVFGKGFQAVSLEPVFIPEHLKALHQGRTMAADWAAMAAYNPDLALTEQERYAKSHAARVDIHAGDGRPSVYTLGYQQEGAWGHMMDAVKEGAVIVDVRKDVTGNIKKGWDQASLKKSLGEQYVHIPELGNVNHGRTQIKATD